MMRLPFLAFSFISVAALAVTIAVTATPSWAATPTSPSSESPIPKDAPKEIAGAIVRPRVFFVAPKDGATVSEEFTVQMGVSGLKLGKAGEVVLGSGHHHLIIDGGPIAKGQVVPKDERHLHFGGGETSAKLKLSKGTHTLTLQFADGAHISLGDELSQTIKINVK